MTQSALSAESSDKLLRIVSLTLTIAVMCATMFNIVLGQIKTEFGLGYSEVSWISSAYLLVYAIGSVIYGKLADIYKLKNVVTFGFATFAIGSLIGLAANSYGMLLAARIVQAAGAAIFPALSGIIPIRYYDKERRGKAIGTLVSGLSLGAAIGPAVTALIVSFAHWRWLFCLPLLVLPLLPYYRRRLDGDPGRSKSIDWLGGAILAAAVALLMLAVTYENGMLIPASAAVVLLFALRVRAAAHPFVEPALFRNGRYLFGLCLAFLVTALGYSIPFLSPQLLAQANGIGPGWIGLCLIPGALASAWLGRKGGRLADKKGHAALFYAASALLLIGYLLLSTFAGGWPGAIALILIAANVGQSFIVISVSHQVSSSLSPEQAGVGMGMQSLMNFIAGAIAAGVYGKIADQRAAVSWNPANGHAEAYVFGNLYLALAGLQIVFVLLFFAVRGRASRTAAR
ncbi:MFS transporter [Cohnella xylanilytica]|uniref:MFS transporter n=1 Tax=Cohnella xylanilytica TaxID=557555 RepID=UPI001B0D0360|nr:MFS transporter [Cohnella xylanilytica]GIO12684.1 MFS transporter [Cohnella xylanilytica]